MAEEQSEEQSMIKSLLFKFGPYILVILVIAGATAYLIKQKPEVLGLSKGPSLIQAEVESLTKEVGKFIELPKDEVPTVATVTDVEKVREQPFFAKAKNGDKVLIYTNARKAILYRPSDKRIIEVGAVNINQEATPSPESGQEEEVVEEETPTPTPEATPEETTEE